MEETREADEGALRNLDVAAGVAVSGDEAMVEAEAAREEQRLRLRVRLVLHSWPLLLLLLLGVVGRQSKCVALPVRHSFRETALRLVLCSCGECLRGWNGFLWTASPAVNHT